MPDAAMIWNLVLSAVTAGVLWWVRTVNNEINDLKEKLSQTREDVATDYALKADVDKDVQKLLDRFDRFENKLDSLIEKIIVAHSKA